MPIVLYGGVILMFNVWEEIQIIPSWWYDPMPHALTPPPTKHIHANAHHRV